MNSLLDNCVSPVEKVFYWAEQAPDVPLLLQSRPERRPLEYTRGEVARQVGSMAVALRELGLQRGDRVAILGDNSPHWLMADLAIQLAGCISVPVYTSMSFEAVQRVVEMYSPGALMLGAAANWPEVSNAFAGCRVVRLPGAPASASNLDWIGLVEQHEPLQHPVFPGIDDKYTILQTSGSTGLPKGVVQTFRCPAVSSRDFASTYHCDEHSRYVSYLPLAHAGERTLILGCCIHGGGSLYFAGPPEQFIADLQAARPTFFLAVPRIWEKLRQASLAQFGETGIGGGDRDAARQVIAFLGMEDLDTGITGGAPMPPKLSQWYAQLGLAIYETYASSEIASAIVSSREHHRAGSVGRALPHVAVKIADNGEILIKSESRMLEYYDEPEKTRETLVDGWVHTGDMGRLDEDGYLYITGRVRDIYKTAKGKYVAPLPIERLFAGDPLLEQVCLVGSGLPQPVLVAQNSLAVEELEKAEVEARLVAKLAEANDKLQSHEKIRFIVLSNLVWNEGNGLCTHSLKIRRPSVEDMYLPLLAELYPTMEKEGAKLYWQ